MVSVLTSDFTAFTGGNNNAFASDTTSSGLGGVVVLSSTDCSSSSSACSGHSDITEPGSPYSSPTSAALCSPEEFPSSHSEESEDSPSPPAMGLPDDEHSLATEEEPRPPDPCWPPFQEQHKPTTSSPPRSSKKRAYPFNNCNATSTPKRFRNNSGNTGTTNTINHNNNNNNHSTNTTSLIPYQPVNINNNQKPIFQKLETKINNNLETQQLKHQQTQQQQQQQKWPLSKGNLGSEGIKGQGKITEYFKTQLKATSAIQKSNIPLGKKGQVKSGVKKDSINKYFRLISGNASTKDTCLHPAFSEKDTRGSKILNMLLDTDTVTNKSKTLPSETNTEKQASSSSHSVKSSDEETNVSEKKKQEKQTGHRLNHQSEVISTPPSNKNGIRNNKELELNNKASALLDFNNKSNNNVLSLLSSVETAKSNKVLTGKEIRVVNRLSLEVQIPDIETSKRICQSPRVVDSKEEAIACKPSADVISQDKSCSREDAPVKSANVIETTSCKEIHSPDAENKTENAAGCSAAAPLSPILSQPRVIRFPVPQRSQQGNGEGEGESVRCCWSKCELEFRCGSKLLEHLQGHHVNPQMRSEQFVCLWVGCKVYARTSCSLSWLERHVLSHGGSKPFRCIVDGCGQRFSSQSSLERHVNGHFNAPSGVNGNGNSGSGKRNSLETASNKLFKRNGKKLRYRRQPWSARMFDYIDTGMMEGLQYRLLSFTTQQLRNVSTQEQEEELSSGNCLALRSQIIGRRVEMDGTVKVLVSWLPQNILPDEWLEEKEVKETQTVPLSKLPPSSSTALHHSLLPPNCKATQKPRKPAARKPRATNTNIKRNS